MGCVRMREAVAPRLVRLALAVAVLALSSSVPLSFSLSAASTATTSRSGSFCASFRIAQQQQQQQLRGRPSWNVMSAERGLGSSSRSLLADKARKVALGVAAGLFVAPSLLGGFPATSSTGSGTGSRGGMFRSLLPPAHAARRHSKRTLKEKLAPIPAFLVVNGRGNPYLISVNNNRGDEDSSKKLPEGDEAYQGYRTPIHTCLEDAEQHMFELLQQPGYQGQVTILVVSLGRAFDMIKAGWRPTGFTDDNGRDQHTAPVLQEALAVWDEIDSFIPERCLKNYKSYKEAQEEVNIPLFMAEGLVVEENGETIRPLYMDPRDLVAAWKKAAAQNAKMPREPPRVAVLDLPTVILRMEESDSKEVYKNVVFIPSSRGTDFVDELRDEKGARARPLARLYEY